MRTTSSILSIVLLCLTGTSALAGDDGLRLENVEGRVSVQMPIGFLPAEDGLAVHEGQQIIVRTDSSVIISSSEGSCFVSLRKPGVFKVPQLDDCTAGQVMVLDGDFQVIPVNGPGFLPAYGGIEPFVAAGGFVAATFGAGLWTLVIQNQEPVTTP